MTPELRAILEGWLESGDETQRRHARARLAIGDAVPDPPVPPPPVPLAESIRGVRLGLRNCFYATSEGCGCSGAMCHHLGRVVTLPDCLKCLPMPKEPSK